MFGLYVDQRFGASSKEFERNSEVIESTGTSFDDIVKSMQGEVAEEVLRKEEQEIVVYSVEDDALYQERIGVDEVFEDEAEDRTAQMASKQQHERVMAELASERDAIKTKYAAVVVELAASKKAEKK